MPQDINVRAAAAAALDSVICHGRSFSGELDSIRSAANESQESSLPVIDPRDTGLYRELCFGTLRHYYLLDAVLAPFLRKPLGKKDGDIRALLLLGLYQIIFLRTPDHASLNATVDACIHLKKPWAKGLVNAVLRNYLRSDSHNTLHSDLHSTADAVQSDNKIDTVIDPEIKRGKKSANDAASRAAKLSHPLWLYLKMQQCWPEQWRSIIDYNNSQPPMSLRVHTGQLARADYRQLLEQRGIASEPCDLTTSGLILGLPVDIALLPHFEQAWVSVQDCGAQLAAELLDAQPGERVLDACAAPGGKTAHILQRTRALELTALDVSPARLALVSNAVQRCTFAASVPPEPAHHGETATGQNGSVQVHCADAAELDGWWRGVSFDKILLDAPCSGTGIISHHPDIKLLRRPADLESFAAQQLRLLTSLWPALAEGGLLLYCTCSIMPEENGDVIKRFIAQTPDASLEPLRVGWGEDTGDGHQLLPKRAKNGGFFYARLSKSAGV